MVPSPKLLDSRRRRSSEWPLRWAGTLSTLLVSATAGFALSWILCQTVFLDSSESLIRFRSSTNVVPGPSLMVARELSKINNYLKIAEKKRKAKAKSKRVANGTSSSFGKAKKKAPRTVSSRRLHKRQVANL